MAQNHKQEDDQINKLINTLLPCTKEIALGSIFGYCAGYFSKKFVKKVAYVAGGIFVVVQVLSYTGRDYINVNWKRVEEDLTKKLDVDGDGKFTTNDVSRIIKKYLAILTTQLPSSGGFALGFYYGVK